MPKPGYRKTELGELPEEWDVVRLIDVADYINGYAFSPKDWRENGIPIIRIQNLNDSAAEFNYFDGEIDSKYIVENGDLLFSWSASIGVYIWRRGKAVLNQHIFKVVPKSNADKLYLYYALFLAIEQLKNKVHGSTMKHFKRGELKTTFIPLPPLPEQRRIAKVLSTVDRAIEKTEEEIKHTERLKKGLMQKLLTRGIGHEKFKDTELGRTPEEWEVVRLGDVNSLFQYGLSIKMYDKGEVPIVKMDSIINGEVKPVNIKYVSIDNDTFMKYKLEKGDLLINRTNSYELVGRTGIFLLDGNYVFASYLIRLRPDKKSVEPKFLAYYLNFNIERLRNLATRAVSQANINATNLKNFRVALPTLPEQRRIAEILGTVDKKLELLQGRRERLERVKKGLMNDLLTGRKRVPKGVG